MGQYDTSAEAVEIDAAQSLLFLGSDSVMGPDRALKAADMDVLDSAAALRNECRGAAIVNQFVKDHRKWRRVDMEGPINALLEAAGIPTVSPKTLWNLISKSRDDEELLIIKTDRR